jgi:hypothetical protein
LFDLQALKIKNNVNFISEWRNLQLESMQLINVSKVQIFDFLMSLSKDNFALLENLLKNLLGFNIISSISF